MRSARLILPLRLPSTGGGGGDSICKCVAETQNDLKRQFGTQPFGGGYVFFVFLASITAEAACTLEVRRSLLQLCARLSKQMDPADCEAQVLEVREGVPAAKPAAAAVSKSRSKAASKRKPHSNPHGWAQGHTSIEELEARPNRVININSEQDYEFCSNFVKTSKYEPYSFLPLFLWEEFNPRTKIANVYFLFIAGLQVIPSITNRSVVAYNNIAEMSLHTGRSCAMRSSSTIHSSSA
jgi:Phospholipid-translocating ATPase N-terminal